MLFTLNNLCLKIHHVQEMYCFQVFLSNFACSFEDSMSCFSWIVFFFLKGIRTKQQPDNVALFFFSP